MFYLPSMVPKNFKPAKSNSILSYLLQNSNNIGKTILFSRQCSHNTENNTQKITPITPTHTQKPEPKLASFIKPPQIPEIIRIFLDNLHNVIENEIPEENKLIRKIPEPDYKLQKFSQPNPTKDFKHSINSTLSSVIISMCGMRLNLHKELAKTIYEYKNNTEIIKTTLCQTVSPQNITLSNDFSKLSSLHTEQAKIFTSKISGLLQKSADLCEKAIQSIENPLKIAIKSYTLPCGHKIGYSFFNDYARNMKSKMPSGPLNFKCSYDCPYILSDCDLINLLGPEYRAIIHNYDVNFLYITKK